MTGHTKKSLGQHWLNDRHILSTICDIAQVESGDDVLEIGPGPGSLTKVLLERGAKVTAVELDNELALALKKLPAENLTIINQDILKFDLSSLPRGYKVVANIPYYLTSNLIRNLSESINPPRSITLLVQKEVAERICAEPGSMSVLSVSAQVYYDCSLGPVVGASKFTPPPKVDSQIVNMLIKSYSLVTTENKKNFFRIVKAGFSNRRKTLENSLAGGLQISKQEASRSLKASGIDTKARAQELTLEKWLILRENLTS
ncbi:MAG TPA: 16S rRNA (adenine(1518)-N(6)/adenine(1519)-N(6))-dimethyltransferase RsmA [Candidatus Saccharimonadales bacterium]|nr:16S rRNA (adenine(1518)-N(6)/adenine(1519)-N(6))-dimethyltransferase RsmA [Candidatus Saccharimonadales bacterium]